MPGSCTTSLSHRSSHLELSVHSTDSGPSGEFSTRDQSRIFFYARSDELNIFNKLQNISDLDGKYFPSLRLPRKIPKYQNQGFCLISCYPVVPQLPSCLLPVLLKFLSCFRLPKSYF
ncbi:hypothetical protein Bca4012_037838 [Brassica carinata]